MDDLSEVSVGDLLSRSRAFLMELRRRAVIRSGNAPVGDYAELIVQRSTGGTLAASSQKSWDVLTPGGERLQVKARIVTGARGARGERQLSPFRSWDFDAAVIVLFDNEFHVSRAARLPAQTVQSAARFSEHVHGHLVVATDDVLGRGEDWTDRLRNVVV
jgi:hypothetical protein